MTSQRYARIVFVLLLMACGIQALVYYPKLPFALASHFDAAGRANGWSSKSGFFQIQALVVALVALLFGGLPAVLSRFPDRLINLPHKDYWLAPERREATLASVAGTLTWFGCAALLLMLGVTQLVIRYNLQRSAGLASGPMWLLIGGFALCALLLPVRLLRFVRRPAE